MYALSRGPSKIVSSTRRGKLFFHF